ncbi:MAG TPA: efflux RND transporter permease subunit, partial [Leptospiraceae bacterium]|nr:efflux RND transporter permease subunit [Leptospiraceae bacterium]
MGIKIAGPDLGVIQQVGNEIEAALKSVPGTASAFAERVSGGRYIEVVPDRLAAARYGLTIEALQRVISVAVGGEN